MTLVLQFIYIATEAHETSSTKTMHEETKTLHLEPGEPGWRRIQHTSWLADNAKFGLILSYLERPDLAKKRRLLPCACKLLSRQVREGDASCREERRGAQGLV